MQRLFGQDIKIMLIFKVCRDMRAFVNVQLFPDFTFLKLTHRLSNGTQQSHLVLVIF